jgi:hypothetical protein
VAAALRGERPNLTASEAAAALVGTAAPRGAPGGAGGGDPLLQAARVTPFVAQPAQVALQPGETAGVRIAPTAAASAQATAAALAANAPAAAKSSGLGIRVSGRPGHQVVFVTAPSGAGDRSGRIDLGPVAIPFQVLATPPPAPPLGRPRVILTKGRPDGVRFIAGSISRGDKGTSVIPVGNLVLTLSGPSERELTPPGGAHDLLPGEYAYTLTDEIKAQLKPGRYRFVLRARGTAGGRPVVRHSRSFKVA